MGRADRQARSRGLSRRLFLGLALAALAGAGVAAWSLTRRLDRAEQALEARLARIESLEARLADAQAEVQRAWRRIDEAGIRRDSARERLSRFEAGAEEAERERALAEGEREEAAEREEEARRAAAEARRQADRERLQREEEWARLASALARLGSVRRDGRTLRLPLDQAAAGDREKLSRLAGILLAHHGYRVAIEHAAGQSRQAEAIERYLGEAGVPAGVLRLEPGERLALRVADAIPLD